MHDQFDSASQPRHASFLWVDLTREASTALGHSVGAAFAARRVREPAQVSAAILVHAPPFLCFEFDQPDAPGIAALARTRREHPGLPVLMITGRLSETVAKWARRIRVWDLLVKPVSHGALSQRIRTLIELTRGDGARSARATAPPRPGAAALSVLHRPARQGRTTPAVAHVAAHFAGKIALEQAAALCRLGLSQFCRLFKLEQGVSFAQYLLRFRLERACERLAHSDVLVKEVAYAVGFNDLSYFSRTFRRQLGVCPREYQAGARSS